MIRVDCDVCGNPVQITKDRIRLSLTMESVFLYKSDHLDLCKKCAGYLGVKPDSRSKDNHRGFLTMLLRNSLLALRRAEEMFNGDN